MTDLHELAPSHIRAISPYIPGKPVSELERELGISPIIKLASNENPLGPSPKALEAAKAALPDTHRYPDGNGFELKEAISKKYSVAQEAIVLGNGSNDVLELAARTFLLPGTSAVYSRYAFAVYPLAVQAMGAAGIEVAAKEWGHDLEAMLDGVNETTKMVFIANPNNPTGTFLEEKALLGFLKEIPSNVLVVLDEAYDEYLPRGLENDSIGWLNQFPNLIVTRTFSKAYGLAGFRVGFALCHPKIADLMNRVRQPFNVNSLAQAAASAALFDRDFLEKSHAVNLYGMKQITAGLDQLKIAHIPSFGNFLCFEAPHAAALYQKLLKLGVIVRPLSNYAMPGHLRVSIGLEQENAYFLKALASAIGESK